MNVTWSSLSTHVPLSFCMLLRTFSHTSALCYEYALLISIFGTQNVLVSFVVYFKIFWMGIMHKTMRTRVTNKLGILSYVYYFKKLWTGFCISSLKKDIYIHIYIYILISLFTQVDDRFFCIFALIKQMNCFDVTMHLYVYTYS